MKEHNILMDQENDLIPILDFSGKEQLYRQLYDILFQDIVNGAYAVGDLIPSESELMRQYGVSRATARKAMEMLANNGMISKRRGVGSEVISSRPSSSLSHVTSFIKKNVDDRVVAEKRLIDATLLPADADVAQVLKIDEGVPVYRLRRIRFSGDEPFYLEINHFEQSFLPHAIERDFSRESLRAYIADELGIQWSRATQEIRAVPADAEQAMFLGVQQGDPLLYIKRVSYDANNVPREFVKTYYRADLYHLEVELDA